MEYLNLIFNFLLGGGVVSMLIFYRSKKRKENAQASLAESEVIRSFAQEWREIAESRERKIIDKDAKIDALYATITEWRDRYNALNEMYNIMTLAKQSADYRVCNKRGCGEREPQTGF